MTNSVLPIPKDCPLKWRVCAQGMTYEADDSFVVYFDPASGRTHLINEVAAWLLAELASTPLTEEQLQSLVMSQVESVTDPEVEKMVDTLIQELQSFDLIEAF